MLLLRRFAVWWRPRVSRGDQSCAGAGLVSDDWLIASVTAAGEFGVWLGSLTAGSAAAGVGRAVAGDDHPLGCAGATRRSCW
jgi:hypothetical protein